MEVFRHLHDQFQRSGPGTSFDLPVMGIADPDHVAELLLCQSAGLSQLTQSQAKVFHMNFVVLMSVPPISFEICVSAANP